MSDDLTVMLLTRLERICASGGYDAALARQWVSLRSEHGDVTFVQALDFACESLLAGRALPLLPSTSRRAPVEDLRDRLRRALDDCGWAGRFDAYVLWCEDRGSRGDVTVEDAFCLAIADVIAGRSLPALSPRRWWHRAIIWHDSLQAAMIEAVKEQHENGRRMPHARVTQRLLAAYGHGAAREGDAEGRRRCRLLWAAAQAMREERGDQMIDAAQLVGQDTARVFSLDGPYTFSREVVEECGSM